MLSQIHDPTLPCSASNFVASLLAVPGGVAADTPVPASVKAGMESGIDGNADTAPKEACDLLMIGDSLIDTLHGFGGKDAQLEAVWNRHYAPRNAVDLGHSGIRTEGNLANLLRINDGLAALAKEAKSDFLDLGAKFRDAEGNLPVALMSDAVQPTLAGYQIWGDALAPSLP